MAESNAERVLGEIVNERDHQNRKWPEQDHDRFVWLAILTEEVGEVAKVILEADKDTAANIDHEIIQVAAVAAAWRESRLRQIDRVIENVLNEIDEKEGANPGQPGQVTCRDCGSKNTESKLGTDVFSDSVAHRCKSCDHSWRVPIKDGNRPGQVYRIVYRTVAGAKPTFIHVRAESETRALMAFIDGTSPLQVSAVQLDNEYGGPLLNERENFWPANDAKVMAKKDTGGNDADDI